MMMCNITITRPTVRVALEAHLFRQNIVYGTPSHDARARTHACSCSTHTIITIDIKRVEEEMEMKQKLKRAAMKMLQGALTRSFERWAEHVEEEMEMKQMEMKQKLKRAAMKMFQGALTRSFERWAKHVEEEMEMKQKLKRAAMKLGRGTGGVVGVLLAASDDRQRPLLLPRARRRQHRLTPGPRGVSQSHKRRRHCHNYLFVLQILLVKHVHNHRIEHAHIRQHNHKHQVQDLAANGSPWHQGLKSKLSHILPNSPQATAAQARLQVAQDVAAPPQLPLDVR